MAARRQNNKHHSPYASKHAAHPSPRSHEKQGPATQSAVPAVHMHPSQNAPSNVPLGPTLLASVAQGQVEAEKHNGTQPSLESPCDAVDMEVHPSQYAPPSVSLPRHALPSGETMTDEETE